MKLVPLFDRVVLKQLVAEETTASGIVLPGQAKEKPSQAEVVAVGPGGVVDGKEIKMQVKVGDKVEAGAPIIEVDWEAIKDRIPSKETMVMVTNTPKFNIVKDSEERRTVNAGDHVAEATKK